MNPSVGADLYLPSYTLSLHAAPYTMELGRLLYLLADARGTNPSRHVS